MGSKQETEVERLLLENYEVDLKYFINKYNVPIIGKKAPVPVAVPAGKENGKGDGEQKLCFFD